MKDDRSYSHHEECPNPKCDSSDGFAVYSGHSGTIGTCFVCGHSARVDAPSADTKNNKGRVVFSDQITGLRKVPHTHRGISKDTLEAYGWFAVDKKSYFPYFDKTQALIGFKVRDGSIPKNEDYHFTILGKITDDFYGTKSSNNRRLLVTTGEYDAMAAHEILGGKSFTCVSSPNGDRATVKVFEKNIKYLDSFDDVYLCFDSDESGKETTKKVLALYPRAKVVVLDRFKDVNEVLLAKEFKYFTDLAWAAQRQRPEFLKDGMEAALATYNRHKIDFVATGNTALDKAMNGGFRAGEYIVVMGTTGTGKTSLSNGIISSYIKQGKKVLMCATEEGIGTVMENLAQALYGIDPSDLDTIAEAEAIYETFREQVIFLEPIERFSDEDFYINVRAAVIEHHIDLFVVDTISNDMETEFSEIASRCRTINKLVRSLNFACMLVTHMNRAVQGLDKEGNEPIPSIIGAIGTGSIERLAHYFLALRRVNQGGTELHILKARGAKKCRAGDNFTIKFNPTHRTYCDILEFSRESYADTGTSVHSDSVGDSVRVRDTASTEGEINGNINCPDTSNSGSYLCDYTSPSPCVHNIFPVPDVSNIQGEVNGDLECADDSPSVLVDSEIRDSPSLLCGGESYKFFPPKPESVDLTTAQQAFIDLLRKEGEFVALRGLSSDEFPLTLPEGNTPATWTPQQVRALLPPWGKSEHGKYQAVGEEHRTRGREWAFEVGKSKDGYPLLVRRGYVKAASKLMMDEAYKTTLVKRTGDWVNDKHNWDYFNHLANTTDGGLDAATKGEEVPVGTRELRQPVRDELPPTEPPNATQPERDIQGSQDREIQAGLPTNGLGNRDESRDGLSLEGEDIPNPQPKPKPKKKVSAGADETERANQRKRWTEPRRVVPEVPDSVPSIQPIATKSTHRRTF